MNNSTENVTLYAAFIQDVIKNYQDDETTYEELLQIAKDYDISQPFNLIPIKIYNEMCAWIEENLGRFNLIRVGRNIGETVYQNMIDSKALPPNPSPFEIMKALVKAANEMIQDPLKRGWVILSENKNSIILRRTQTFNSVLQLGLLDGLIRKAGVAGIKVEYLKEVRNGDEYDEYEVSWI
jgi:hypothetical protein